MRGEPANAKRSTVFALKKPSGATTAPTRRTFAAEHEKGALMRITMSLNGLWKFCPAFDELVGNQRWMDGDTDPAAAAALPKTQLDRGWVRAGFDDSGWMDTIVPSSWNSAMRDLWSYEGHGWYRRPVFIPAEWRGRRVEFVSEGANYRTVVHVNGVLAGAHEGGYNPFAIAVQDLLRYGEENLVAVAVDNVPKPDRAPGGQFGWWNHGGLYRDVALRVTDPVYIDDVTAVTELADGRATLRVRVEVNAPVGAPAPAPVSAHAVDVLLLDPSGASVALPPEAATQPLVERDGMLAAEIAIPVERPALWSPDTPRLYTLRLALRDLTAGRPGDVWEHRIGLRTIRVEGTRLLLNGEPLLVKGINRHEQYPGGTIHTQTPTEPLIARDIDLVKWVGGNALRHHYPAHRRLYELCDERGVLAMVEVPLWQWGRPLVETDHPDALATAKRQCEEIIRTYKNHACVFMWSISNENLVKPKPNATPRDVGLAKMTADGNKELVALAHRLDPTRPVVEVSNEWPDDPVHEVTDVTAVNVYVGAPNPPLAANLGQMYPYIHKKLDALRTQVPDKPIIVAEFGKWTVPGFRTPYPPGEEYQAEKLRREWEGFLNEPGFVGGFIWCFADYDLHRRFLWAHEYRCAYGIFDIDRHPKAAAFAIRKLWTRAPEARAGA